MKGAIRSWSLNQGPPPKNPKEGSTAQRRNKRNHEVGHGEGTDNDGGLKLCAKGNFKGTATGPAKGEMEAREHKKEEGNGELISREGKGDHRGEAKLFEPSDLGGETCPKIVRPRYVQVSSGVRQ